MPHVLQNVVFPVERDPDLLPLYVDPDTWSVIDDEPVRMTNGAQLIEVLDRRRARIRAGERVSFASYFNAFPASYWQHWTTVRRISLTVRTSGAGTVLVYRSTGAGTRQRIEATRVEGDAASEFSITLDRFGDGGWIWFDIAADEDVVLSGAEWTTPEEPVRTGRASVGITTYNKPGYCVDTLAALADAPDVLDVLDRVFVVDQGSEQVSAEPRFDGVSARLGQTLQVIRQPNLGGSGGFARAMLETLDRPESEFVQLLDDDVRIEPESIRRSVVFARYTSMPTIVGGHMFDLLDRPKLHAWAEVVDDAPFMWRRQYEERFPHDFSVANLRQTPMLHLRMDADYNGWWMCLIPLEIVRRIGLPLPAFIKWDDAEYSLRARDAGYSTVSVPGVALWHVSWVGKDDSIDWQAYFHARNRIVSGLLHSQAPHGGTLIRHSRRVDLKHLMSMQYYPIALRHRALSDILSGPSHLLRTLATAMPEARALTRAYPETVVHRESDGPLRSRQGRLVFERDGSGGQEAPTGLALRVFTLRVLVSHWFHAPRAESIVQPDVEIGHEDAAWWRLPPYDSAIVSSADGAGKNVYRRDRTQYRRMLLDSIRLHRRLRRDWDRLSREYRSALGELTSPDTWRSALGEPR